MSKNIYLERYAWPQKELPNGFSSNPDMIVVIPCFNEPNISKALEALHNCQPPESNVAILLVVNESESASSDIQQQNLESVKEAQAVSTQFEQKIIHVKLPQKHAGVGLARKIGMDEAVRSFESQHKNGIIVCFDADCSCSSNYLEAIWRAYKNPQINLAHLHYEHSLEGPNNEGIIRYELHLRYYCNALRVAKYPYAMQTLGSCITVRSDAYQKQGGMNRRKAGEDFYFIHKCMPLGGISEINTTTIYPSDRVSDRVPFGTGHAIAKYLDQSAPSYYTYHPQTFMDLFYVNECVETLWNIKKIINPPASIVRFYEENDFQNSLDTIFRQASSFHNFKQRYYAWWDGFKVLKYIHFCRDHFYEKILLDDALTWLNHHLAGLSINDLDQKDQLLRLRQFDRQQDFYVKL